MVRRLLFAIVLLNLCLFAAPITVSAFDPFHSDAVNCTLGDEKESAVCKSRTSKDPLTGTDGVFIKLTRIVAFMGGAAAIIVIIVGAIRYVTSGGDSSKVQTAKDTVMNALIGIIVIVAAQAIIVFVIRRL